MLDRILAKISKTYRRFPKVYWTSMSFELFERGAYYSFTPIIVYHALYNLGIEPWLALQLFTFLWPIQYGIPILSGAIVERVGYRKQIAIAFSLMTIAYLLISRAVDAISLIIGVMLLGVSIGIYKPLISAIVAKVTTSKDRNYGFGIYYWIVNIAAAFFPLGFAIAIIARVFVESQYNIIFMVGAGLVSVNVFIALFLFEDIPRSTKVKSIRDAINNVKISMADRKFMVLVMLIAGFWGLYSMQLTGVIAIIFGYRFVPTWFNAILYAIFNPMTIVIAGPVISKFIEKSESIRVMIGGVLVFNIGLLILGFGVADWRTLVTGIIIMSIGEFMVAPGFYSFTSKLATEDKVSAYIGSTFISTLIGLALGSFVLGILATYVVIDLQMPYFFLGIAISFAFVLFIAFLVYYQIWGQSVIDRAKRIAEEEEGKKKEIDEDYKEPILFRLFETKVPILLSLILIPIVLFSTFSLGTFTYYPPEDDVDVDLVPKFAVGDYPNILAGSSDQSDNANEGGSQSYTFTVSKAEEGPGGSGDMSLSLGEDQLLKSISFSITWSDEGNGLVTTNTPDVFELNITHSSGWSKAVMAQNSQNEERTIIITYGDIKHDLINSTIGEGDWDIVVTLLNAGDYTAGPRDREVQTDTGNSYQLSISTEVYAKEA